MDLEQFGQTLRRLRKEAGLTQKELARRMAISDQLLSIWERAYKHGERVWQPDRAVVMRLIKIFRERLSLEETYPWAIQSGHDFEKEELAPFFPQEVILQSAPIPDHHVTLQRLAHLPDPKLFGMADIQAKLTALLYEPERPWLLAIDGLGGIGKTSLAHALALSSLSGQRFHDVAWISARQEEFLPEGVIRPLDQPALTTETFVDTLLTQLDPTLALTRSHEEKAAILTRWLKTKSYLVIVDNLETAVDYESLLPILHRLANPTKFFITTRYSVRDQGSSIYSHSLRGLSETESHAFLRHIGEIHHISALTQATETQLQAIYETVGGNPLALKLVVGQLAVLPLNRVLDHLRQADTSSIEALYIYIYWQAWNNLSPLGQQMLVAMPLAQGGNFEEVMEESELDAMQTGQALQELTRLSLIEVGGDLTHPRYSIHRLTETFLLNEVIKWQFM